jgi:beta-lactamase class A
MSHNVVRHRITPDFAALTESTVPAVLQPEAEALMSRVAKALHDHLRAG